jgi:hypothetical protein
MSTQSKIALEMARKAAQRGDRARARELLREIAEREPNNEEVYLLFAQVAQKRDHAIYCLQRVLEINPYNEFARRALEKMQPQEEPSAAPAARPVQPPKPTQAGKPARPVKEAPKRSTKRPGLRLALLAAVLIVFALIGAGAWYTRYRPGAARNRPGVVDATAQPVDGGATPSPESRFPGPEEGRLDVVEVGQVLVRVGDPSRFENVWELIEIEDFDTRATRLEGRPPNWWGFELTVAAGFEYPHPVKFRATIENPATENLVPVLVEETIGPSEEAEDDEGQILNVPLSFFQFVPSEDPNITIEVVEVEILRINDMTEDEWTKPDVTDEFYRDVWLVSNPTSEWMPLAWEMQKVRPDGEVISSRKSDLCTKNTADFFDFFKTLTFVPPGKQIVITEDFTAGEALSGVKSELRVAPLETCPLAEAMGIAPDRDIEVMQLAQSDETIHLVFDNGSGAEAFAVLYLNVYDAEGKPVAGQILQVHQSSVTISPNESGEFELTYEPLVWLEPEPVRYEVVFLGLRR